MTRVDFYVPAEGAATDRYAIACRLTEKAYHRGHRVYIHVASDSDARRMDELLWTFRQGSFVPHGLIAEINDDLTPVLIGADAQAGGEHDVLINMGDSIPAFFSRFERVAEVVEGDQTGRQAARERFRFYRDRGYPLDTHDIG